MAKWLQLFQTSHLSTTSLKGKTEQAPEFTHWSPASPVSVSIPITEVGDRRRGHKDTLIGSNLWARGVVHTPGRVVEPTPTKAPGWETREGGFSRENRDKLDQKRADGGWGAPSKCPC